MRAFEHRLRCAVLVGGEKQGSWSAQLTKAFERGVQKHSTDSLPSMCRVDHQIVEDARRSAQGHEVISLHPAEDIADDLAGSLGDEDEHGRLVGLRDQELAVPLRQMRHRRDEALCVESMMLGNEKRPEPTQDRSVLWASRTDDY